MDVRVDDAQLRRAVVALRVLAPNAIRPIEDLVPLLYPGVKVSYGTIQQMLAEAEGRAARFNVQVSLGGVEAGALDEMFSQGEPVLAGVDLDSGYLLGLSLSATRDGEAWAELLREGQAQGLELSVVRRQSERDGHRQSGRGSPMSADMSQDRLASRSFQRSQSVSTTSSVSSDGPAAAFRIAVVDQAERVMSALPAVENNQAGSGEWLFAVGKQPEPVEISLQGLCAGGFRQPEYRRAAMSIGCVPQYAARDAAIGNVGIVVGHESELATWQDQPIRDCEGEGRTVRELSHLECPQEFLAQPIDHADE